MKLENKLTINKLIANDIINYAMDNAISENYNVSLNTYLNDFDDESKKYILKNIDTITEDIRQSENVLDLVVQKENNNTIFDMIFYWEKLLNQVEHIFLYNVKLFKIVLNFEDIHDKKERELEKIQIIKDSVEATEQAVKSKNKFFAIDLDFEDIQEIANDIIDDDEFNNDLIARLKNYGNGKEI